MKQYPINNLEWESPIRRYKIPHDCYDPLRSKDPIISGKPKLDEEKVLEIRRRLEAGETPLNLGREYGVSEQNIRLIESRETWSDI